MDEIVFKDHRTLTYFFYKKEFHFIRHTKGEGPVDVQRLAISKVGDPSDFTRTQRMSRDYLFMRKASRCQLTCQLFRYDSVEIHRLYNIPTEIDLVSNLSGGGR